MTFRALGIVVFGLIVAMTIGFGEPAGKESGAKKCHSAKQKAAKRWIYTR